MPITNDESETKPHSNGITLREFFTLWLSNLEGLLQERWRRIDDKFLAIEEARRLALETMDVKFKGVDDARKLALETMDRRLEGMNEFRNTLRDQSNTFLTKEAYATYTKEIDGKIRQLENFKLLLDTKADTKQVVWAYVISGISLLIGFVAIITKIIAK